MARIEQNQAQRGSQKWLQILINQLPEFLNQKLRSLIKLPDGATIEWLSPLKNDQYSEYQDEDFLRKLDVNLTNVPLNSFWPKRGPVWDALGRTGQGDYFWLRLRLTSVNFCPLLPGQVNPLWK